MSFKYYRRGWLKHLLPVSVFAILMLAVYPQTQLDRLLTDLFFDAQQQVFPLKHHAFLSHWMHLGLKWFMVVIALGCLLLSAASCRYPKLRMYGRLFLWVFVGMVAATAAVAILKHFSPHGCPWALGLYGGDLPMLELFAVVPPGVEPGRCFPAGHPSGGFALMAFYFAFMDSNPRFASGMLWLGLAAGLVMGMVQIMRGAHFLSHVLWSGWVVWVTLLILYWAWPPKKTGT